MSIGLYSEQFTFLGLCWNTREGVVALTEEKIAKVQASASALLAKGQAHVWDVQKFLGLTNFAAFAVPRARLNSRGLQVILSSNYNVVMTVSGGALCQQRLEPSSCDRNSWQ